MRSAILFIACMLLLTSNSRAVKVDKDKSLLWRISGNGLTKPSYLFGTIHLICKADYIWTYKMRKSLEACEKVCFELDLDNRETMVAASEGLMDTSGKVLKDYFTPDQFKILKKFVRDSLGMDIALFQQMKPIALQSLMEMKSAPCTDATSYEENIMRIAQKAHKEILGLEDPSEQVGALATLSSDSVAKEMLDDVANFGKSKQDYQQLINAYKKQELPTLYGLITGSEGLGDHMGALLDDRNKKWIDRMTGKMQQNSVFFAVGAGHLLGANGVINLLRKAGYTVEPEK